MASVSLKFSADPETRDQPSASAVSGACPSLFGLDPAPAVSAENLLPLSPLGDQRLGLRNPAIAADPPVEAEFGVDVRRVLV